MRSKSLLIRRFHWALVQWLQNRFYSLPFLQVGAELDPYMRPKDKLSSPPPTSSVLFQIYMERILRLRRDQKRGAEDDTFGGA